jgi:hypothetical protein
MSALAPIATELLHDGNRREEPCGREQLAANPRSQFLEAGARLPTRRLSFLFALWIATVISTV